MFLVVFQLLSTSALGFVDGELHGSGDGVGIHNDLAVDVSGSAPCSLRQAAMTSEEALLVSVEDSHQ